jgi:hypothetical protein
VPRWFAEHIPQIYTPPLLIGVVALLLHRWRRVSATATDAAAVRDDHPKRSTLAMSECS